MKETAISPKVRKRVLERDSYDGAPCCIVCGSPYGIELHHYKSRGSGGLGIEENLICLCSKHHKAIHQGDEEIKEFIKEYLAEHYPGWDENNLQWR